MSRAVNLKKFVDARFNRDVNKDVKSDEFLKKHKGANFKPFGINEIYTEITGKKFDISKKDVRQQAGSSN